MDVASDYWVQENMHAFWISTASPCPLQTLSRNSSHCSTLQEGCTQHTAGLSRKSLALDVPYTWVHAKVTLARRNDRKYAKIHGNKHMCTHMQWLTRAQRSHVCKRAALQWGSSSVWPSTSHLWRMNHFASNQCHHKTQWARVLEQPTFTVIASGTKHWGQWREGQMGQRLPLVTNEMCYGNGSQCSLSIGHSSTGDFNALLSQDWRRTWKYICSDFVGSKNALWK